MIAELSVSGEPYCKFSSCNNFLSTISNGKQTICGTRVINQNYQIVYTDTSSAEMVECDTLQLPDSTQDKQFYLYVLNGRFEVANSPRLISITEVGTYTFLLDHPSNMGHGLYFSQTPDGVQYTKRCTD